MATVKIQAGAELDILNKGELDQSLSRQLSQEWSERGRGIKFLRFGGAALASVSTTAGYTIKYTPNVGYVWNVRLISVSLAAANTAQFYIGTDTNTGLPSTNTLMPLGNTASAIVGTLTFGSGQVMLNPEEFIVVGAGGSTTLNAYTLGVWEVPAELAWKVE